MNDKKRLTIAISGASKGIGASTVALLNKENVNLILGSRHTVESETSNRLEFPLDVTNELAVKAFYERAVQKFGTIDVLINSAGLGIFESLIDLDTSDFDEMMAVNARGTFLMCKYFGKHMAEQGKGQILNMISIAGKTALPGCGGYSASKFAALGITKVLQAELRGKGVQVTAVLPGAVESSFWDRIDPKPDFANMIPAKTVAEHLVNFIKQPPGAFIDEITIMPPLGIL